MENQNMGSSRVQPLRQGYTTGTCAAAAAAAAVRMLLTQKPLEMIQVRLPSGRILRLRVEEVSLGREAVRCAVRKDSGDDPDVTDGALVAARVCFGSAEQIRIEGGKGVGRVTLPGLPCPVGQAAINPVPRRMIEENVRLQAEALGEAERGFQVEISVPEGERLAKRTFNPKLGILGGISIIGTTGIVEPMSEKALVETIASQLRVARACGQRGIIAVPGNYGQQFLRELTGREVQTLQYSNYLGELARLAAELGFRRLVIAGHCGKLVKAAGGMLNTHSSNGDFRMEVLACYAALAGAGQEQVRCLMDCATVELAAEYLRDWGLIGPVMGAVCSKALAYIQKAAGEQPEVFLLIYTNRLGLLAQSPGAMEALAELTEEGREQPALEFWRDS